MYKIRKVTFQEHPVLGNLSLDFCGQDGKAVDTVIIAGENGTGKSTVLNELYSIIVTEFSCNSSLEIEDEDKILIIECKWNKKSRNIAVSTSDHKNIVFSDMNITSIFSDVAINYASQPVRSVTSLTVDQSGSSRKSSSALSSEINQFIIDIQDQDDASLANAVRKNPELPGNQLYYENRMIRFTSAFEKIFDKLRYSRVENRNGHKEILFEKNGIDIPISGLSSGEKQIVYRGCFLLRDINALNGPIVFIDEPEIGLHPNWQTKIMDFYKSIFSDTHGIQTSQIFVATHSPFIIHNDNRKNDKVIVLKRDENGHIVAEDKPEYYKCSSVEVVKDAFHIYDFSEMQPTVYLEGETDEKYFNKAAEVFGYGALPFTFKWIGHYDTNGNPMNTGSSALDKAFLFLASRNLSTKNILLYDCDTKKEEKDLNNVYIRLMSRYENDYGFRAGVENALVLDSSIDLHPFYREKTTHEKYGEENKIQEFQKMEFCDALLSYPNDKLKQILIHLKEQIDELRLIYED